MIPDSFAIGYLILSHLKLGSVDTQIHLNHNTVAARQILAANEASVFSNASQFS